MKNLKIVKLVSLLSFLFLFPGPAQAEIIDTSEDLIIPVGETYTSSGTHTYTNSVQIDGTLNVLAYDEADASGWIELISPNVTIGVNGKIDAKGKGFRGGDGVKFLDGEGPGGGKSAQNAGGGGHGGVGGTGIRSTWNLIGYGGIAYGNILEPLQMGSGGGLGSGLARGGAGGGVVRIKASGTLLINGNITADGWMGGYSNGYGGGAGSGGSIYIICNDLSGNGSVSANGGENHPYSTQGGGGAGGRIALHYETDIFSGVISAFAGGMEGITTLNTYYRGGAGTIYRKSESKTYGEVLISNNNKFGEKTPINGTFDLLSVQNKAVVLSSTTLDVNELSISNSLFTNISNINISNLNLTNGATVHHKSGNITGTGTYQIQPSGVLFIDSPITIANLEILSGGIVTHSNINNGFNLTVNGGLNVYAGGQINANGKGYPGGDGVNYSDGQGPGGGKSAINGGGGGYGGIGGYGLGSPIGYGGSSYGSIPSPSELGSGGGLGNGLARGGAGGGKIRIIVDGTLINNGVISANGMKGGHSNHTGNDGGCGSGGSVYILTNQFMGNGTITANGNGNPYSSAGGGAGGRIAIYYNNSNYSGTISADLGSGGNPVAQEGTIFNPLSDPEPAVGISKSEVSFTNKSDFRETLEKKDIQASITADGDLTGSLDFNNISLTTIKTGAFAGKGFIKGGWSSNLQGVNYQGTCKGMVYLNSNDRRIYCKAVMEGALEGSVEGYFYESFSDSDNYDMFKATWTFKLTDNLVVQCGIMYLDGTVMYNNDTVYDDITLNCVQASAQGDISGGYTGKINTTLTSVNVNDISFPDNKSGFVVSNYVYDNLEGKAWGYSVYHGDSDETELTIFCDKPLFGIGSGSIVNSVNSTMWLLITKLDIGSIPKPDLDVVMIGPVNASSGQTVTYTVVLTNKGVVPAENIEIVVDLPIEARFLSASGDFNYFCMDDDWGSYESIDDTPENVFWQLPTVPAKSTIKFDVQAKLKWGLTQNAEINAEVSIYDYIPE